MRSSSEKWAFFVCFVPTWTVGASGRGICMDLTVMFRPVPRETLHDQNQGKQMGMSACKGS